MSYPLISEYVEAVKLAEDNLDKLSYLRPVLNDDGSLVMSSGNFAVVFKMKDERDGRLYALKCFIKEQEGRAEAYKLIADELEFVSSDFIASIQYHQKELFVDSSNSDETEFPVLLMDWVEGMTLDKYIRKSLHDLYALQLITYQFCRMASWLMSQTFAHGDLKPDNILVKPDGQLVLVDYDGIFVPAMKGQKARETGSPDYRHPSRCVDDFDEHIDDFSMATIAMQLYAIALQPDLLTTSNGDTLLLNEGDYCNLGKSEMLAKLMSWASNAEFAKLLGLFLLSYSENSLSNVSFRAFMIDKPFRPIIDEELSSKVTDEDKANGVKDKFGVLYSPDGLRLLDGIDVKGQYSIKPSTRVICDGAFSIGQFKYNHDLTTVSIPDSVTRIGDQAFFGCRGLTSVNIPSSITSIGDRAFSGCRNLAGVNIPDSVTDIGDRAFSGCRGLTSVSIPNSITSIGDDVFWGCSGLTSVNIPDSVTSIGKGAFWGCSSLERLTIPDSVINIGDRAFAYCESLARIDMPISLARIGADVFEECPNLTNIYVPNGCRKKFTILLNKELSDKLSEQYILLSANVMDSDKENGIVDEFGVLYSHDKKQLIEGVFSRNNYQIKSGTRVICDNAFCSCSGLSNIIIPDSVTYIGRGAFRTCIGLTAVTIPNSVSYIGDDAFRECSGLTDISIPKSVIVIGDKAFRDCSSLIKLSIPNSVIHIGEGAFRGCDQLIEIKIPDSVTYIGDDAFAGCLGLASVIIPNSVTYIGEDVFRECSNIKNLYIPKGSHEKFVKLLGTEYADKLIEICVTN